MIRCISRLPSSIVTAAFLLGLCGCIPEFREPLSNGETSEVDEQALGTWYLSDDPLARPMTIVKVAGTKAMEAQFPKEKGQDPEKPVRLFTTKIGEKRFVSMSSNAIYEKDGQKKPETFLIFAYKIEGKTLQLFTLKDDAFGAAVVAGQLKGTVRRPTGLFRWFGPKYVAVAITDSPKKLREFLAASKGEPIDREPSVTCRREPPAENKARTPGKP